MPIWSPEIKGISKFYQTVKSKLPKLEKELGKLIVTNDENMLLVYSRRCLEVIIADLCEFELKRHRGTEPLQRIIDKLNKEEIVPHNIIVSMQNVNSMSTFGAHPKEFNPMQIKPVLLNLTAVLEWYLKYTVRLETIGIKAETINEKVPFGYREKSFILTKRIKLISTILLVCGVVISLIVFDFGDIMQTRTKTIESILILPFRNLTSDKTLDPLLAGMHYELINKVQRSGLRITNKTSSDAVKEAGMTIHEIASKMNVNAVLEPSVMAWGDTIQLGLKIINGNRNEEQLWDRVYRIAKNQLQNWNNNVAKQMANDINIELTPEQERVLSISRTVDWEVYEDYLKSYSYLKDLRPDSLFKARDLLNSAIEKDPDFAELYIALADVWFWIGVFQFDVPENIIYENANKALELDPDLPDAHRILGGIAREQWNWQEAEKEYLAALSINPNHSLTHLEYSFLLYILQRTVEANIHADKGYNLDKLNPYIQTYYAHTLLDRRDYATALSFLDSLLTLDPDNVINNGIFENAAFYTGDLKRSFEAGIFFFQEMHFNIDEINDIKKIFNDKGYYPASVEIIRKLENPEITDNIPYAELALRYYFIKNDDKAIELIEKQVEMHSVGFEIFTGFSNFTRLYDNPRFIAICEKMNLPAPKTD